jgi:hypothetical protein
MPVCILITSDVTVASDNNSPLRDAGEKRQNVDHIFLRFNEDTKLLAPCCEDCIMGLNCVFHLSSSTSICITIFYLLQPQRENVNLFPWENKYALGLYSVIVYFTFWQFYCVL